MTSGWWVVLVFLQGAEALILIALAAVGLPLLVVLLTLRYMKGTWPWF